MNILIGKHYINGCWYQGQGNPLQSSNPASGEIIWQGQEAGLAEVELAYEAAAKALIPWSQTDFMQRCQYIEDFAEQVKLREKELALLISQDNGKPFWEALTEVQAVIAKANISIKAHNERLTEKKQGPQEDQSCLRFKPHGVVCILGAFNFPAHLSNGHIIPALLAGNTILYKPSELTPAVAEFIMQCWHAAKIPPGVINCLQGGAGTGQFILEQDIQGVYFTGSYETGKKIHQFFSGRPEVILALEMGGNNPLIIEEVADFTGALYNTLLSTVISSGQRCTCARRIFIPNNTWGDKFIRQLSTLYQNLLVGSYDQQPEPFMGPVINNQAAHKHLKACS